MLLVILPPHADAFAPEVFLQVRYADFTEVKDAGSQCCIGMSLQEGIAEVLHLTGSS